MWRSRDNEKIKEEAAAEAKAREEEAKAREEESRRLERAAEEKIRQETFARVEKATAAAQAMHCEVQFISYY